MAVQYKNEMLIEIRNPVDRLKYKNGVLERFGVYPADIHKDLTS